MGESVTYAVSRNPFPPSFGDTTNHQESDHQFFNGVGEPQGGADMIHNTDNYSQFNAPLAPPVWGAQRQDQFQNDPPGAEETYFPAQGYRRSLDTSGKSNNVSSYTDEQLKHQQGQETVPPPPPTSFFNQASGKQPFTRPGISDSVVPHGVQGPTTFAPPPPPQTFGSSDMEQRGTIGQGQDKAAVEEQQPLQHSTVASAVHKYRRDILDDDSSDEDTKEYRAFREGLEKSRAKVNPNLQAGRRKLEEFKRKKAAALSRKNSLEQQRQFVKQEYAESKLDEAREEIERLRKENKLLLADVESQA